ncbi:mal d 1-associated protein [Tasmannia lanceolata]|uniref:mal d 1-associated protein n=1 Tax=Tasmannia lanceolata TaxID=3420 RepID=UPI004062F19A
MGWKWEDEEGGDSSSLGFGKIGELRNPNPRSDDRCSTRRIVQSKCRTEEIEPGKFVRKCEKTEQLLKDCVGRPVEVVESNTEYTEDDITNEMIRGSTSGLESFSFPGLRNDMDVLERSVFGGLSHFLEAAQEMKNGFFQAFGSLPPVYDRELPFNRRKAMDGPFEKEASQQSNESAYTEFSGQLRDV